MFKVASAGHSQLQKFFFTEFETGNVGCLDCIEQSVVHFACIINSENFITGKED